LAPHHDLPASGRAGPGDLPPPGVVRAVRDMYVRHPFPPAQRKYSYRRHAAYVHHLPDPAAGIAILRRAAMAEKLPFESQCHVIDMIVRPYWLSLFAEKAGA
jgi:hypothetical protein